MHNALKNDMEMNMNFNLKQDDQVGWIFAEWLIVYYFGHFLVT
jgi:hypothetical protein